MGTHYDSCLVRWWHFDEGGARRYHLEHVQSGRVWHVRNLPDVLDLLQRLVEEPQAPTAPDEGEADEHWTGR
ncbi:hypothetical protein DAERI_100122 [Deinococcus aerius]|uniref:Uncharacterized protein n=1 Tax=Deinococcus aerius TaxID=200253 RepID=A0A2I9CXF7_9DEIO|nr:hypothetical protein [Deinococcus aerius]GBF06759.1 hypothetical protein DAERI_100122 [Deinococcus aerius]